MDDTPPRLENYSGGTCEYTLADRHGYEYPCEQPSAGKLAHASERWGGPSGGIYCKRHAWKALRGSRVDLAADDAPDCLVTLVGGQR